MEYQLIQASKKFYSMDEFGKRLVEMENNIALQDDKVLTEANNHSMVLQGINSTLEMMKEEINNVKKSQQEMRQEASMQAQEFTRFRERFYNEYQDDIQKMTNRCNLIDMQMRDLTYQIQQAAKGV